MSLLRRLAPDLRPLRASRDLRRLVVGNVVTGLGTQATLVALPYQVYVETESAFLTGLLGAAELVPLAAMALLGGALADRHDRRRLLLLDQIALVAVAGLLAALAFATDEAPLPLLFLLAGALAGFGAVQNVTRSAIIPNLVAPELVRPALATSYGLYQLTLVVGPALGGLLVAAAGVGWAYALDAVTCLALVAAVVQMAPQPPAGAGEHLPVRRSVGEGLRFVRRNDALMGSFAIDLLAMTFGMPRALFPVLALAVYDAGAAGTGLLHASVAAGATVAALTTGWLTHARWLGRIVAYSVVVWGLAIAAAGLVGSIWLAAVLLALAGVADSVSAVCRQAINQAVTPDRLRGRMSSVFSLVVTSGPRMGDVEAGAAAALGGVRFSVVSGGVACAAGVAVVLALFPALWHYDAHAPAA
ncbi:MFS transporter [Conexibacter sp. SYSU D00693]|uniref:MFS transporter n=1 Tax=Conexibacter sp. SYSU D00693 TaxID=2812560 RepID=UPI00196B7CDE|nr:MFS transporter [Conexibacter sp. SYSU D00693]